MYSNIRIQPYCYARVMPRRVDHDARRAEIVQGVWAVIAEGGIDAVRMRRVAKAAGVSVGRIQHYFTDRADLVRASARAMIDAAATGYGPGGAGESQASRETVWDMVAHVLPTSPSRRVGVTLWLAYVAASVEDPELASILADAKRGQHDVVAEVLANLGVDRARDAARRLIGLADGLSTQVLVGAVEPFEATAALDAEVTVLLPR